MFSVDAPSGIPLVTDALMRHGYSEGDIQKIMGQNLLRVFRKAWRD